MPIEILSSGESLAEHAGELLLASGRPEDWTVVFPGKRPAHFLRRYLAEAKGSAQRAPRLLSMDGFAGLAAGMEGRPDAPQLDLAWLLCSGLKAELARVIGRDPAEFTLEAVLPWALKLISDFEELRIELKTGRDLAAYDDILPQDLKTDSFIKKLQGFSRLYTAFYDSVEKAGLLTRSMKYAAAAEAVKDFSAADPAKVIFAGFFAPTASERAIMKRLFSSGAYVLLEPGPGLAEQFSFLGALPPGAEACPAPAKLHFYKAPDEHGEIFGLARALKSPGPGDVIVLPDPAALFPLLENVLPGVKEYNVSMGYPLTATPVYALLDALGDLMDKRSPAGYFAPDYLRFVFHPYVKNIGDSAETGRIIFQSVEEWLSRRLDKYVRLEEIENDPKLLETAAARLAGYGAEAGPEEIRAHIALVHRELIKPFEEITDITDFAAKLLKFVSYISGHSTAPLHPYWAPFVEKAIEQVLELKSSRLAGERFAGPAGYFKLLKTLMQGAGYPFPGTPLRGMQVLGFLETRGLKFKRVFFLDANADVLPAARKEDTILSHFVREGLGLSTYRTRERLARYHFAALLAGAGEAHIFYKDSADKERSPFVEKLAWDLERAGGRPDEHEVHMRVDFSQAEPETAPKTPELLAALKTRAFSPSAVDTYLACGLRFYYQYGLRLREKEEVADELEQRDIGVIVHGALENFFKARIGRPLDIAAADYELLRAEAEKIFERDLKGHNAGFEYLIKRQVERRLSDILDYHREKLPGITVLACETKLEAALDTKYGPVRLNGRADRVDQRGVTVHILDYKTGTGAAVPALKDGGLGPRGDWPATLKSVQLPFYIMAYSAAAGTGTEAMDASLMLLGRENIEEESLYKARRGKPADKAAVFAACRGAITALIEEILDPALPFRPAADEAACAGCPFRGLCGRQWVE